MLTNLHQYQTILTRVFLLIYISGTFHMSAYEVLHLCMHMDDIFSHEYVFHSHQGSDNSEDTAHTHHMILDQLAGDPLDNGTDQTPTLDDNLNNEILQEISNLIQVSLSSEIYNYQNQSTTRYLKTTLPPPKENDEFLV